MLPLSIHNPFTWTVQNSVERLTIGFNDIPSWITLDDLLNRLCLQENDGSIWRLKSHTPIIWDSVAGAVTYSNEFVISDWISGSGIYYIDFNHDLNTLYTSVEIREGNSIIRADLSTIDANRVRITVPSNPDLRFNGSITIK
jgi:hypothetical protein